MSKIRVGNPGLNGKRLRIWKGHVSGAVPDSFAEQKRSAVCPTVLHLPQELQLNAYSAKPWGSGTFAKEYEAYHWAMSRIRPDYLDPETSDRWVAADVLVR